MKISTQERNKVVVLLFTLGFEMNMSGIWSLKYNMLKRYDPVYIRSLDLWLSIREFY